MTSNQWLALSPYLEDALEISPEERPAWLESLRLQKPTIALELVALLLHSEEAAKQRFLERRAVELPDPATLTGQSIGVYRLVSQIGRGGMSTVWLAERQDGRFERRVAIKFLNIALIGNGGEQRFQREGKILGLLVHPNIAELIDAGVLPTGQPYLVLEHIDGGDIDRYCDEHNLDIPSRIGKFLDVLQAVAKAHANLIVHRDLKPSNVLVGSNGHVKLLDFGIAKLLEDEAHIDARSQLTLEFGQALTPLYAAPEQLNGEAVTTAADVYSLGVLLYVLLTGRQPIGQNAQTPVDLIRAILEEEPRSPAEVVAQRNDALAGWYAARRSSTPERLRRMLLGDLDTIVAKALKKHPSERYESVTAMADDLRRHLRSEPISARPVTVRYRAAKFIRRNSTVVALAGIAAAASAAGLVATALQVRSTHAERDLAVRQLSRAERITNLNEVIITDAAPTGVSVTLSQLLEREERIVQREHYDSVAGHIEMLLSIVTWFDYDNDGWEDMYVVNMWESAGSRVTGQSQFMPTAAESIRRIVRQDALGNTLLHNEGTSGKFRDTTDESGTRFGGWNWGSEAWDFDHDGYQDLYVANGFISGENHEDLSSFFWRQIAARSFDSGGRSQAYTDAWSAINEFIRCGYTWSGYQRNNFFLNNRNSTFTEAASVLGIDCIADSRSFALSDLDGDGRLEIVLKNRTAPQLRIFQNRMQPLGTSILFSLRGTKSNRDAVGAVIELETASGKQIRTLRAGSGFLSQNTKAVHFGLGRNPGTLRATIQWPNGARQVLENLLPNHRIEVVEGAADSHAVPFNPPQWDQPIAEPSTAHEPAPASRGTWLLDPIQIPSPLLKDADGTPRTLNEWRGRARLLAFASPSCSKSTDFLVELEHGQAEWKKSGIAVIAIVLNAKENGGSVPAHITYPLLFADEKASRVFDVFRRYIFDRRQDMPLPSALLLDDEGDVVRVYHDSIDIAELSADCDRIPRNDEERLKRGLPFPGRYLSGELHRDYFMYGVAYMQYEEYEEAQAAFEKSLERSQTNPIAYYDLGLIALYRSQFAEARSHLEKAVALDPSNADAWNNLGVATGQLGDQDQARRDFQRALDGQPAHPTAVQNMIKVLRYLNRPQEARVVLLKAIEADPRQAQLHSELGMILIDSGDIESARAEFERAVHLEPSNPESINALGVVYMQMRNDERAMQIFEKCRQIAPNYGPPVLNMAVLYLSAGKADKAHDLLSDFLRAHPDNKDARDALQEVDSKR